MAHSNLLFFLAPFFLSYAPCLCQKELGGLDPHFYDDTCPQAQEIVKFVVAEAAAIDGRMPASLLRLHFHDCFVQGCDESVLLNSTDRFITEQNSIPNYKSIRWLEVIDEIKSALEEECPNTVSCADILAMAGGPNWEVPLGRRDSLGASLGGNSYYIPSPNDTLKTIYYKFKKQNLNIVDLVALSGSHTIGLARCVSFRQRLYNKTGKGLPIEDSYAKKLRSQCPESGGDQKLFYLDFTSPAKFDNYYFKNLVYNRGLLGSDQELLTQSEEAMQLVQKYAENNEAFFDQYAKSIVMYPIDLFTTYWVSGRDQTESQEDQLLIITICDSLDTILDSTIYGCIYWPNIDEMMSTTEDELTLTRSDLNVSLFSDNQVDLKGYSVWSKQD